MDQLLNSEASWRQSIKSFCSRLAVRLGGSLVLVSIVAKPAYALGLLTATALAAFMWFSAMQRLALRREAMVTQEPAAPLAPVAPVPQVEPTNWSNYDTSACWRKNEALGRSLPKSS
jgi:hypothetical protein